MAASLPCSIVNIEEIPHVNPALQSPIHCIWLALPDGTRHRFELSKELAETVTKAWKTCTDLIPPVVGDVVIPNCQAWRYWGNVGLPQAFRVSSVSNGVAYDRAFNRKYNFSEIVNITYNRPPSLEALKPEMVVIPSMEAWTRSGSTRAFKQRTPLASKTNSTISAMILSGKTSTKRTTGA